MQVLRLLLFNSKENELSSNSVVLVSAVLDLFLKNENLFREVSSDMIFIVDYFNIEM